jgi:hypothetical protein
MPSLRSQSKSRIHCLQFTGRQYFFKDLPRLAQAVTEAMRRTRMLGLVGDESEGSE